MNFSPFCIELSRSGSFPLGMASPLYGCSSILLFTEIRTHNSLSLSLSYSHGRFRSHSSFARLLNIRSHSQLISFDVSHSQSHTHLLPYACMLLIWPTLSPIYCCLLLPARPNSPHHFTQVPSWLVATPVPLPFSFLSHQHFSTVVHLTVFFICCAFWFTLFPPFFPIVFKFRRPRRIVHEYGASVNVSNSRRCFFSQ